MPINLVDYTNVGEGESGVFLGVLCQDEWGFSTQVRALEQWLENEGQSLVAGDYLADIGFSPKEGALGGGAVLTPESMGVMSAIGMTLFLSEYSGSEDET